MREENARLGVATTTRSGLAARSATKPRSSSIPHVPNANSSHRMPGGILGEDPQVNLLRIASRLMFQHHFYGLVGFQICFEQARSEVRGARGSDADDTGIGVVDV